MGNRNEKVQELDFEQMEQISGGVGGAGQPVVCTKCKQFFRSPEEYVKHLPICPGKPSLQPTIMP